MSDISSFCVLNLLVAARDSFVYVVGYVGDSPDLQFNAGGTDMVLLKYTLNGDLVWTALGGTTGSGVGKGGRFLSTC